MVNEHFQKFCSLFRGFDEAFGTGAGTWVKRPQEPNDFFLHLEGAGKGIGIAPLMRDGTVYFAAIDLDEPDFEAAHEMQQYIPGTSWIEKSRSGNAHVWVFFKDPIEAWIPRGILKEAVLAAGKGAVEVFPKQDQWHDSLKFGSYINLPYHGDTRPVIHQHPPAHEALGELDLDQPGWDWRTFAHDATATLNDPEAWIKRARWLMLVPPQDREQNEHTFGQSTQLHMCAEWIIAERDDNPVVEGHRAAVYFALAKMLTNYEGFDSEEAFQMMKLVNESSPDPVPSRELRRILRNAENGRWTSTDCDNPLVQPYAHPNCPIAHPRG